MAQIDENEEIEVSEIDFKNKVKTKTDLQSILKNSLLWKFQKEKTKHEKHSALPSFDFMTFALIQSVLGFEKQKGVKFIDGQKPESTELVTNHIC